MRNARQECPGPTMESPAVVRTGSRQDMDLAKARAAIRQAKTEEAVVKVVQEHLDGIPEADLELLPAGFRTHLVRTADDVSRWALYFNREDLTVPPDPGARSIIRDLVMLLVPAAWRLAEIMHAKGPRHGGPARREE